MRRRLESTEIDPWGFAPVSFLMIETDITSLPICAVKLSTDPAYGFGLPAIQAAEMAIHVNRQANLLKQGGARNITVFIHPTMRRRLRPTDVFASFVGNADGAEGWLCEGTLNGYMVWASSKIPEDVLVVIGEEKGIVVKVENFNETPE